MKSYKSILCLNGNLPHEKFIKELCGTLIAADGAAMKLANKSILPDVIIGDGDSLQGKIAFFNKSEKIIISEQNTTDFEKSLEIIKARKLFPCLVLGISGGELDHTLNNINIFMRYSLTHNITFIDSSNEALPKVGWGVKNKLKLKFKNDSNISLLAKPKAKVSTTGLKWPLKEEFIKILKRNGARNKAIKKDVKITVHSGQIIVITNLDDVDDYFL